MNPARITKSLSTESVDRLFCLLLLHALFASFTLRVDVLFALTIRADVLFTSFTPRADVLFLRILEQDET